MFRLLCPLAVVASLVPFSAQAGTSIPLTVNTSEAVTVTGTPQIAVDVGGVTRYAIYTSGSGTNALTFTLSPQEGDLDLDGITLVSPVQLNGGTLKDAAGNDATLTFTLPNTSGILVNYPSVGMNFTYDADGRYTLDGNAYNDLTSFLTAAGGTFSRASTATYFDSTGTLQTAASGVPRFDYDRTTHVAKGLLLEEARTNWVKNANATGATVGIIGSGGVMPTGWNRSPCTGISHELVGTGTVSGLPYTDVHVYGTNTTGAICYPHVYMQYTPVVASVQGDVWSVSAYTQIVGGTYNSADVGPLGIAIQEFSGTGVYLTGSSGSSSPTGTFSKKTAKLTVSNASTASIRYMITFSVPIAATFDFTLRIAAPQLEKGTVPTSFIPTSTGAVTRQADTLTLPTGAWYNASAGGFLAIGDIPYLGGSGWPGLIALDDGTSNNAMHLFVNDSLADEKSAEIFTSGVTESAYAGVAYVAGATTKQAMAYATNNARGSMDGTLLGLDTAVNIPTVSVLRVGSGRSGNKIINGHIQKINYYPLRPTDTQLQKLTQ